MTKTITLDKLQALSIIESYHNAGARLHHFNGSQWYIELNRYSVAIVDSSRGDDCTLDFMTGQQAVDYLTTSSNCREENAFTNAITSLAVAIGVERVEKILG